MPLYAGVLPRFLVSLCAIVSSPGDSGASLSFWYLDEQASSSSSSSALDIGTAWSRPIVNPVGLDMFKDACRSNLLNNK